MLGRGAAAQHMVAQQSGAFAGVGGLQARALGLQLHAVVVHEGAVGGWRLEFLFVVLHGLWVSPRQCHIPGECAQVANAVQLVEEELVVGVQPVNLPQQVAAATAAVGELVELVQQNLSVREFFGADAGRVLAEQLSILTQHDHPVLVLLAPVVALGHNADGLLGVVRVGHHGGDLPWVEVTQAHKAIPFAHVGDVALLAQQAQRTHAGREFQRPVVDGVRPEGVEQLLVLFVLALQRDTLGQQVGQGQFHQAVGKQVALPQVLGHLLHAVLRHGRQVAVVLVAQAVAAQAAPAGLVCALGRCRLTDGFGWWGWGGGDAHGLFQSVYKPHGVIPLRPARRPQGRAPGGHGRCGG